MKLPRTDEELRACRELRCEHPRCLHGRPHCPHCPAPRTTEAPPAPAAPPCAVCAAAPRAAGSDVCQPCRDAGNEALSLFG